MTAASFQEWMIFLFKNYGKEPDRAQIKFLSTAVERVCGMEHKWADILCELAANEKFFPSAATIIEYVRKVEGVRDEKYFASQMVDKIIVALGQPSQDWAGLGREGYMVMRQVLGVSRTMVASQGINLSMMRKQWIEMVASHFEKNPEVIAPALELPEIKLQVLKGGTTQFVQLTAGNAVKQIGGKDVGQIDRRDGERVFDAGENKVPGDRKQGSQEKSK